jgi:thiamine kinase-like enzyme
LKTIPEDHFGFNVLNHGDLWINNMMFKYDCGKPIDVKFVDFQNSHFGNPGQDLNYFFVSSVDNDSRNNYDCLIKLYHSILEDRLNELEYDQFIPSLEDVHVTLKRFKDISIISPVLILPTVKLDKKTSAEMSPENLADKKTSGEGRSVMYKNKIYEEALVDVLKFLERIDHLDQLIE